MPPTYQLGGLYPRVIWGSPSEILDLEGLLGGPSGVAVGAQAGKPDRIAIRSDRNAQFTPRREVVLGHLRDQVTFGLDMVPGWKAEEIDRFAREWGLKGKQFEFYLNRFQGAALEFSGNLADQHGTLGTFTGTPSYEAASFGRGLRLDAGEFLDFPTAPVSQQPSLIAAEGIVVLVVKPSFTGGDSLGHSFIVQTTTGASELVLQKISSNVLRLLAKDSASGLAIIDIAVSWAANSEQKIVAKWKDASSMELWLNGVKGPAAGGGGTGLIAPLAASARIGARAAATEEANGLYDRLMFFTRAFDLNASIVQVLTDTYVPYWPNYFNKGELVDARMVPAKIVPGQEFYRFQFTVQKGVA
jgi:hypothetical protein